MTTDSTDAREARARRQAERQGLKLHKLRGRDAYAFADPNRAVWVSSPDYPLSSLDAVERWLADDQKENTE